jgi:hypothetical protein
MYRFIIDDGVHNRRSSLKWKCRVPIKIKVFNYVASSYSYLKEEVNSDLSKRKR